MLNQLMGMLGGNIPANGQMGDYIVGEGGLAAVLNRLMEAYERDNRFDGIFVNF